MALTAIAVLLRILSNPLANVFQKQLTERSEPPLKVNFITFLLLSAVCIVPATRIEWAALPKEFWVWCTVAGIFGATGNGFLVKALQGGDLSVLGPINSYKSVVGMIAGILLLGEIPGLWGVAGIALIVGGSYFVLDTLNEKFSPAILRRKDIRYRIWAMVLTAVEAVFIKGHPVRFGGHDRFYHLVLVRSLVFTGAGTTGRTFAIAAADPAQRFFALRLAGALHRHDAVHDQLRIRPHERGIRPGAFPTLDNRQYPTRLQNIPGAGHRA